MNSSNRPSAWVQSPDRSRRGVLLLVVLSMLTLFLMLGTTYLVVASRARATARAFAKAAADANGFTAPAAGQRLVDDAFMIIARGPLPGTTGTIAPGDDLLGDKYGTNAPLSGTLTPTVSGSSVLVCTVSGISGTNAAALAGRVITFQLPQMGSASTRILRATASGGSTQLYLPGGATVGGKSLSAARLNYAKNSKKSTGPDFIINGREFSDDPTTPGTSKNEPWDGFDQHNPFLAKLYGDVTSGTFSVLTSSYTQTTPGASTDWIDNDGDGNRDSQWLDLGFPALYDDAGTAYKAKAAILVVDLDGRVNLNVHGSDTDFATFDATTQGDCYPTIRWSQLVTPRDTVKPEWDVAVPLYTLPRGYGAGPADVSLSRSGILKSANPSGRFSQLVGDGGVFGGRMNSTIGSGNSAITDLNSGRLVASIGGAGNAEGRAGEGVWKQQTTMNQGGQSSLDDATTGVSKAGTSNANDLISRVQEYWRTFINNEQNGYTAGNPFIFGGRSKGPSDLKGRMKIWVGDHGQPTYYKPYWSSADRSFIADDEALDDPYEVNLGRGGPRSALLHTVSGTAQPADNLYAASELEGILRFYDSDQVRLPRRLVTALGAEASNARFAVTTESWDTPAVDGKWWQDVVGSGTNNAVVDSSAHQYFSPDTLMGHRLDLNQPFHDAPNYTEPYVTGSNDTTGLQRRQLFAKQIYCLLVALFKNASKNATVSLPTANEAEELAQWAINIVDFRDGDSIMTPFDYDPGFDPATVSWNASQRVWGCERPELLLAEAMAWHDRRTEDMSSPANKVQDLNQADDDFDQKRRPRGAFFVEIYSPWGATSYRYAGGTPVPYATGTGGFYAGEPRPSELVSSGSAAIDGATIDLGKLGPGQSPVWRLATVRGDVKNGTAFGAHQLRPTVISGTLSILDPARKNSIAKIDRTFYFAEPDTTLKNELTKGGVFWQSTSGTTPYDPSQSKPIVAGTPGASYQANAAPGQSLATINRPFDMPFPASLTEPTSSDTSSDPYDQLMKSVQAGVTFTAPTGGTSGNNYVGSWNTATDQPLDAMTSRPASMSANFLDSNSNPLLMLNGSHNNFAVIHLQRLADPTKSWDSTSNPYLTVDCLTVDLTVVNTDADGTTNRDEPGTSSSQPLTYLTTQRAYTNKSVVRGGRVADVATGQAIKRAGDIWNRNVRPDLSNSIDLIDETIFRSKDSTNRTAYDLVNKLIAPALQVSQVPTVTQGFGGIAERNSIDRRYPWLYWANRPFNSATELALVPITSPFNLTAWHSTAFDSNQKDPSNASKPLPVTLQPFFHLPGFFDPPPTPISPWNTVTLTGTAFAGQLKPTILDFVHVRSPFGGLYGSTTANPQTNPDLSAIGLHVKPFGQFSHFREPGRVNVNTIADKRVWRAIFGEVNYRGDPLTPAQEYPSSTNEPDFRDKLPNWVANQSGPTAWDQSVYGASPANSLAGFFARLPNPGESTPASRTPPGYKDNLIESPERTEDANHDFYLEPNEDANGNGNLDLGEDLNNNGRLDLGEDTNSNGEIDIDDRNGNGMLDPGDDYRNTDRHAFFRYETMNRLTNVATVRSNVFAVWITIGFFDATTDLELGIDTAESRRYRGFYIFDRSIPVGYETGKDNNVRDAILLRRVLP